MKKIIIVLFFIVFITFINQDKEEYIIPDSAIRLRVIANSNTFEDQATKMEIKNNIESILQKDLVVAPNKETASLAIKDKIPEIQNMINHYDIKYNLNYGKNYFPEKSYKGVKYEAGDYECRRKKYNRCRISFICKRFIYQIYGILLKTSSYS